MNTSVSEALGFSFSVVPMPRMTGAQRLALEREIEDFAQARDLLLGGDQLQRVFTSSQHSLSATEQVELLDSLLDRPGIAAVTLSPLLPGLAFPAPLSEGYLRLVPLVPCVIGLTLLYRLGHIKPAPYLEILGGFVQPLETP